MDRIGRLNGALSLVEIDLSLVAHGAEAAVARVNANHTMKENRIGGILVVLHLASWADYI
jgi:hypothetical protein